MKRLVPALIAIVLPFAARAAVEDGAAPPLPTADGTTPPSPTAPAPATAPAPSAPPAPTPLRRTGLVRAAGPGQAAAVRDEPPRAFNLSASVYGGYDSNVLLVDNERILGIDTGKRGAAVGVDAKGVWHALNHADARLNVIADAQYDDYPSQSSRDLLRFGGLVTGLAKRDGWDPGFALGLHQYRLDGDRAANILNGSLGVSRVERDWVAIPTVEVYATDYAENDDATGALYALHYRHWFLLAPSDSRKRIEAGLRVGWYDADSSAWSYATVRPELALAYRLGPPKPTLGTVDLGARVFYEYRHYGDADDGTDLGHEHLGDALASVDWWTCPFSALGIYAEYTVRDGASDDRDYDRFQIGARISAAW